MSTQAMTHVIRDNDCISLFQRSDGYPTWVLQHMAMSVATGISEPGISLEAAVSRIEHIHYMGYSADLQKSCADRGDDGLKMVRHIGPDRSTDTHTWVYVVDFDKKDIAIYCNDSYIGEGQVDPLIYLKVLYDEAKPGEKASIDHSVGVLREAGFTINGI